MKYAEQHRGAKRRRWVDEDLQSEIVRRAAGQQSAGSVARVVGVSKTGKNVNWDIQHLVAYSAASWSTWENCEVLSVASDASRVGAPAEETEFFALTDGFASTWAPVQVVVCMMKLRFDVPLTSQFGLCVHN